MKECPTCNRELKDHLLFCPFDGHALVQKKEIDKLIGSILDDKYHIEEKVGEGGMGTVYRATHVHMGNTVAIKVLHSHLSSDATALERFRREARAAAFIRHPNAVAVTDFGVAKDTGIAYLVMEFLEGIDLRQKMKSKDLDYEEILNIVQQTCSAVQAAHAKGIIHRDLKPDNIWILAADDGVERIKVLDFGIAKLKTLTEASNLTQQGMIVGTPYYMSPEQCRGEELDAGSDIYSLGVIAYEMLTGDVPFRAPTPMGIVLKHTSETPTPPHELRASIPFQVEEVVLRALAKKPEYRQESAIRLGQELEGAMVAAGIELKNLLRTPHSLYTTMPPAYDPERTAGMATGPAAGSPAFSSSTSPRPELRSDDSFNQRPVLAGPGQSLPETHAMPSGDHRRSRFSGSLLGVAPATRRLLLIALVALFAIVAVGAILAVRWMTRKPGSSDVGLKTDPGPKPDPAALAPEGMVYIAAGKFVMGNRSSDDEADKPEHETTVLPFYIDKYEVTNEQYYEFLKNKPGYQEPLGWKDGKFPPGKAKDPVTGITWLEAREYGRSLQKRLPTEAEWEYAARGTDKRIYPWGSDLDPQRANIKQTGRNSTAPVGQFAQDKSPFDVFDLAGNASEWTDSPYELYAESAAKPMSGRVVVRGGSYALDEKYAMVTHRLVARPDQRSPYVGFRCAKRAVQPQ